MFFTFLMPEAGNQFGQAETVTIAVIKDRNYKTNIYSKQPTGEDFAPKGGVRGEKIQEK
jgi:hypothetical protein